MKLGVDERGQLMLNAAPMTIHFFDTNLDIVDCNAASMQRYQMASKDDFFRNFYRLMPPIQPSGRSSRLFFREMVQLAFDRGQAGCEFLRQKPDGTLIPTEIYFVRAEYQGDYVVISYSRDLTEVHAAMEREKEARETSEKLMESTPLGIELWHSRMNLLDCNQQVAEMFGFVDKDEYMHRVKKQWKDDHIPSIYFNQAMEDGFFRFEWEFKRINNSSLHCEVRLVRTQIGNSTRVVAYFHDLSDIRAAMEQTREVEKQADHRAMLMLDSTPLACFLVRENVTALDCNLAAVELFGFEDKADAIENYRKIFPSVSPEGEPMGPPKSLSWMNTSETMQLEYIHCSVTGEYIPCEVSMTSLKLQGNPIIAVYLRDLREIKKMHAQAIRVEVAEEESRAKSQFLARMSHEIRTPMNAIKGIADIELLKTGHPPETEESFLQIRASSNTLISIINDILDMSKVEAGKMEIITRPYETASLIYDTVQLNLIHMDGKSINFALKVEEDIPEKLVGDEIRIKQILGNLLSNAFKYTREGEVKATFGMERNSEANFLTVKIEDTGQGMTKEQISTLFDSEYIRYNEETNRMIEGTGLGMNIANSLIKKMGGEISAESFPGIGTTFLVRLPQEVASEDVLGKEIAENLQSFQVSQRAFQKRHNFEYEPLTYGKVLVVDDVESNLFVAKGLLMPYGLTVDTAMSGLEALRMTKAGNVYDIIFMDHMMPDMDGIETAKLMFASGYKNPIVALTANTIMGQSELFLNNGFAGFISKPIDVATLNSYLIRLVHDKYPEEVRQAAKLVHRPEGEPSSQLVDSFLRDAARAISVLDELLKKTKFTIDDFKLFIINTHGMKSALANIGKSILSETSGRLEQWGNEKDMEKIRQKAPEFLENLKETVILLTPKEESFADGEQENISLLRDKLKIIKEACDNYNKKVARKALEELNGYSWSKETKELLNNISAHLLHSAFEEASEEIGEYL